MRREFSRFLDFPEHRLRVIAPDVGGAFGAKNNAYPEELLAAALALKLGCAVKWIEERQEHMLVTSHARAQTVDLTAGVDRDGRINALHFKLTADMGAYYHAITPVGAMMTAMLTVQNIIAGEQLYDIWNVNEDAEYHEAGASGAEQALKSVRMVPKKVGQAA